MLVFRLMTSVEIPVLLHIQKVIRRIFRTIVMPPNFIRFHPKIGFKSELENFALAAFKSALNL